MVAFNIESWIWYAVVLLIAGSRLLVSPKLKPMPICTKARSTQASPKHNAIPKPAATRVLGILKT
jgi:hypothetical protein